MPAHLTAQADPFSVRAGFGNDFLQQPQKRRLQRIVEFGEPGIRPICAGKILEQVVRTDAEEIKFPTERVELERGGRDFNHRTDGHVWIESTARRAATILFL